MRRFVLVLLIAFVGCADKKTDAPAPAAQQPAAQVAPAQPAAQPAAQPGAQPGAQPAAQPGANNPQDPGQAMAKMFGAMAQATQNPNAKAVNWRDLVPLFPDAAGDWKATDPASGESTAVGGFQVTEAKRKYKKDTFSTQLKIVDTSMNAMLAAAFNMARMANVDASDHYQRGIDIGGNPGVEEWRQGSKNGKVTALVGGRFIVEAECTGVPDTKDLLALVTKLDLAKLAGLGK